MSDSVDRAPYNALDRHIADLHEQARPADHEHCFACGRSYADAGVSCYPDPKHAGYSYCAKPPLSGYTQTAREGR